MPNGQRTCVLRKKRQIMTHPACWIVTLCLSVSTAPAFPMADSLAGLPSAGTSNSPVLNQEDLTLDHQNFFRNFFNDEGAIWTSPLRMHGDEAEIWGGVVAATAVAMTVDEPVSKDLFNFRNQHLWVRTVSPIATQFGQFYVPYGIAAFSCLDGLAFGNDERIDTGLLEAQAMLHSGIVVQVLKHLFGRSRPFVDNGTSIWYGPRTFFKRYAGGGFSPYDSFPSGHTITAFSLAQVIAERESPWIGTVAYTCAGLCGVSRITQHDHWLSDVVMGGALGVAIGHFEVAAHETRYSISPNIGLGSAGVLVNFN